MVASENVVVAVWLSAMQVELFCVELVTHAGDVGNSVIVWLKIDVTVIEELVSGGASIVVTPQ